MPADPTKRHIEIGALVAVLVFAALCLGFARVADEMVQGDTRTFDTAVMLAMRDANDRTDPVGPPWFEEAVRDFTSLGSTTILVFISLGVVGYLALSGAHGAALLVAGSVGSGIAVTDFLKETFARARPDLVPHAAKVFSQSFPSGHAALSAVTYLTLGALLARVQPNRVLKTYLLHRGDPADAPRGRQPRVSGRSLADRRARRLVLRRRMGHCLLAVRGLAAAPRAGRKAHPQLAAAPSGILRDTDADLVAEAASP